MGDAGWREFMWGGFCRVLVFWRGEALASACFCFIMNGDGLKFYAVAKYADYSLLRDMLWIDGLVVEKWAWFRGIE
jgi:hypothetical protein